MSLEKKSDASMKFIHQQAMLTQAFHNGKIDQERYAYGQVLSSLEFRLVQATELAREGDLKNSKRVFDDVHWCFVEVIKYISSYKPLCDRIRDKYLAVSNLLNSKGLN